MTLTLRRPGETIPRPLALSRDVHPLDRTTVMATLLAIPLGLIGADALGFGLGGWAWTAALTLGLIALAFVPLPTDSLRSAMPLFLYLVFALSSLAWTVSVGRGLQVLGQMLTIYVVYVVAWRVADRDPDILLRLRVWALVLLPSTGFVFIRALGDGASTFGWIRGGNAARPMVMTVSILYLMATVGRSRRFTITVGVVALLLAIASGGRMGAAVIAVLILLNPSMRVAWRTRLILAGLGLMVLGASLQFEPVQQRLFVGQNQGTLEDIVALERNFNTAGRSNNWPNVLATCAPRAAFGNGVGSTHSLTLEATLGRTPHPHNEFLRTFCDAGVVGALLFWGFFVGMAWRGLTSWHRRGSQIGALGALTVLAVLLFSSTDNATIYTSVYMGPVALMLGIADRAAMRDRPALHLEAGTR